MHPVDHRRQRAAGLMFGRDNIFPARSFVYGSTEDAYEATRLRLIARSPD